MSNKNSGSISTEKGTGDENVSHPMLAKVTLTMRKLDLIKLANPNTEH